MSQKQTATRKRNFAIYRVRGTANVYRALNTFPNSPEVAAKLRALDTLHRELITLLDQEKEKKNG